MSPLTLNASRKMGAPLLYCSINDTLINRNVYCQSMFTKLINVFDSTSVQVYNPLLWNLIRILCVAKIIIIIITLGYMQITFASFSRLHFTGVVDTVTVAYVSNFCRILHTKNYYNRFVFKDTSLLVSSGTNCLNLFQPILILASTAASASPSTLNMSPR